MPLQFIDHDFVAVRAAADSTAKRKATLAYGDAVEVLGTENGFTKVRMASIFDGQAVGFIKGRPRAPIHRHPQAVDGRRAAGRRDDPGVAVGQDRVHRRRRQQAVRPARGGTLPPPPDEAGDSRSRSTRLSSPMVTATTSTG